MAITSTNPTTIPHPEIPYDKYLVYLSMSPIIQGSEIEGAMNLTLKRYRVLPSGAIDVNDSLTVMEAVGDCYARAQTDPVLAAAMGAILPAIQQFITDRGY